MVRFFKRLQSKNYQSPYKNPYTGFVRIFIGAAIIDEAVNRKIAKKS
jgi:hypothetical protein